MSNVYVRLTEHNDHEGETWYFYIPVGGNEDAVYQHLSRLISTANGDGEEHWSLSDFVFEEGEVDVIVKYGMDIHNKMCGTLTVPDVTNQEDAVDLLYKGGLANLGLEDC
jgi:hypothetical protein